MDSTEIFQFLNTGGVLAIMVLIVWTGKKGLWMWTSSHKEILSHETVRADKAEARADRMEISKDRLYEVSQEKVVPAVIESTIAVKDATKLMRDIREKQKKAGS